MIPFVHLPDVVAGVLDVAAWAVVHTATGYAAHRLPPHRLQHDGPVLRIRAWERDGRAYERLAIRRWKDRLPEAGALFAGGTSKRAIPGGRAGMGAFAAETRRAERAHLWALAAVPLFAVWNPPVALVLLALYGLAANLPCIAVQRYNRARLLRVARGTARSSGT